MPKKFATVLCAHGRCNGEGYTGTDHLQSACFSGPGSGPQGWVLRVARSALTVTPSSFLNKMLSSKYGLHTLNSIINNTHHFSRNLYSLNRLARAPPPDLGHLMRVRPSTLRAHLRQIEEALKYGESKDPAKMAYSRMVLIRRGPGAKPASSISRAG